MDLYVQSVANMYNENSSTWDGMLNTLFAESVDFVIGV